MIKGILPNMILMRDVSKIEQGDRLFYELGHKSDINNMSYKNNWIREGLFKEIEDVNSFVSREPLMTNVEFLNHHNFMLIKKELL